MPPPYFEPSQNFLVATPVFLCKVLGFFGFFAAVVHIALGRANF